MPVFAAWLGSLFTSLAGFLSSWMTVKVATRVAAVAALFAVTGTFLGSMYGLLSAISVALPPEWSTAAGWVVPGNAVPCVSALISAHFLRWAYDWNTRIIQYKLL